MAERYFVIAKSSDDFVKDIRRFWSNPTRPGKKTMIEEGGLRTKLKKIMTPQEISKLEKENWEYNMVEETWGDIGKDIYNGIPNLDPTSIVLVGLVIGGISIKVFT